MNAEPVVHKPVVWSQPGPEGQFAFGVSCPCGWTARAGGNAEGEALAAQHAAAPDVPKTKSTRQGKGGLAVVEASPSPVRWSEAQTDIIRRVIAPDHNPNELAFFAEVCRHKGLDPFAGEICTWKAAGKVVIVETAAGLRALAQRTGLYAGQDEALWRAQDGDWDDIWAGPGPPFAAKVAVWRTDWVRPAIGKALYSEFVQLGRDGKPRDQWRTSPANMLAKCAERQAFIRAFSSQMADVGVSTRDISGPSRLSMEARRAGMDDDARHQLAAKVSGGRTDSTRELTEDELLAARAEVATLVDDDPGYVDADGVIHVPDDDPDPDNERAALIIRIGEWNNKADQQRRASIHDFMAGRGIPMGMPLKEHDLANLKVIDEEINRRDRDGWPGEEPF